MDSSYREFISTRRLSWWREYMRGAYQVYEGLKRSPLTQKEKHSLWNAVKRNYKNGGIGSYTALAIMQHVWNSRHEV